MALYGVMQKKRNSIADVLELRLFFLLSHRLIENAYICIYGFMQNRRNSIADALESRLFCFKSTIYLYAAPNICSRSEVNVKVKFLGYSITAAEITEGLNAAVFCH